MERLFDPYASYYINEYVSEDILKEIQCLKNGLCKSYKDEIIYVFNAYTGEYGAQIKATITIPIGKEKRRIELYVRYPMFYTEVNYRNNTVLEKIDKNLVSVFKKLKIEKEDKDMNNNETKFEKVSFLEFKKSFPEATDNFIAELYDSVKLPRRATAGSAGYDFYSIIDFELAPGESITMPTGIRVKMSPNQFLMIVPRSGLGFKYKMELANTVGIIDSDYYYSDNEGHIMMKIVNCSNEGKTFSVERGKGIAQGIFLPYGVTSDDDVTETRNGGFGSTDK